MKMMPVNEEVLKKMFEKLTTPQPTLVAEIRAGHAEFPVEKVSNATR